MTFEGLKRCIYREDGSLRDIYVRDVTPDDWECWVNFVNSNYRVDFYIGNDAKKDKIDFELVTSFWENYNSECPSVSIYLGDLIVKSYFFDEEVIENDIAPKEIKTLKDHEKLIDYLKSISKLLGKPVELTEENYTDPKEVLIVVEGEQVFFQNLDNCR